MSSPIDFNSIIEKLSAATGAKGPAPSYDPEQLIKGNPDIWKVTCKGCKEDVVADNGVHVLMGDQLCKSCRQKKDALFEAMNSWIFKP